MQIDDKQMHQELESLLDQLKQVEIASEQGVDEIVTALHEMAERYSDAEFQGVSDALVLLAELIEPLQEETSGISHSLFEEMNDGLLQLVHQPNLAAAPLLKCLKDDRWPQPVAADDVDFLNTLLVSDLSSLSDSVASNKNQQHRHQGDGVASVSSLLAQMQGALIYQATLQPHSETNAEQLLDKLLLLADSCSEGQLPGFSDLFSLYVELIQQFERDGLFLRAAIARELHGALTKLVEQPVQGTLDKVLGLMASEQWHSSIPEEELGFLASLLEEDIRHLEPVVGNVVGNNDESAGHIGDANQVHFLKSIADPSTTENQCPLVEDADEDLGESKLNAPASTPLLSSLGAVVTDIAAAIERVTNHREAEVEPVLDALHQLSEEFSEAGFQGYADLLVLVAELLNLMADQPGERETALANNLQQKMVTLLERQSSKDVDELLTILSDESWPNPLPTEDLQFIQPLLYQECCQFVAIPGAKENVPTVIDSEEQEGSTPVFVEINFDLLTNAPAAVEPNVVKMLAESVADLTRDWQNADDSVEGSLLEAISDQLPSLIRAMTTVGLDGASSVVDGLAKNIQWLLSQGQDANTEAMGAIESCLSALVEYLMEMGEKVKRDHLVDCCAQLPCAPDVEQTAFISGLLALGSVQDPNSIERKIASETELSLNFEKDVDPDLISMLYTELPLLTDQFSQQLSSVIDEEEVEVLQDAQRTAHTIKGLANMAGIKGLANLTHCLEDILELLTDSEKLPGAALQDDLLVAGDCLSAMSEAVVEKGDLPDNALACLQKMLDWHYKAKTEGLDSGANVTSPDSRSGSTPSSSESQAENQASISVDAESTNDQGAKDSPQQDKVRQASVKSSAKTVDVESDAQQTMQVPLNLLDNLFRIAGEKTTIIAQFDEEFNQLRKLSRLGRDRQRVMERMMADLEHSLNEYSRLHGVSREDDEGFDPLEMDRYNELHSRMSRLHEAADDISEVNSGIAEHIRELGDLHGSQAGLQKEALQQVIETRQVPVSSISARLQRILRQACRSADKKAQLIIEGQDLMIDSHLLSQLADPLMHMVRNAVDHGLESPHLRFEADKPESGVITLSFEQHNDLIRVSCRDDGQGIDCQQVLKQATEKGLVESDASLSDAEIRRLILLPGFSTRDTVSQLSGRGIGMDVVAQRIGQMHGNIHIHSESGQGSEIELTLPSSMLTIRVLLVRVGSQLVALSIHGIDQTLLSIDGEMIDENGKLMFRSEGQKYAAYTMESLCSQPDHDYLGGQVHPVLIVNTGKDQQPVAILVKDIVAHRELIFKEMGDLVPAIPGIPGVTILANGEVAPVIDLPLRVRSRSSQRIDTSGIETGTIEELPKLLVVDDSISARKTLITLLRDIGYEVESAIDGVDALNKIRLNPPDLILTDYEMPRMTGVELSSSVRGSKPTEDIPIIMITSRSTSKHRLEADNAGVSSYITKPWSEPQLLSSVEELLMSR